MGYEILATDPRNGEVVASLTTSIKHQAAHLLMGALGVYYDQDDESGPCDAYSFTQAEVSAAQSALVVAGGIPVQLPTQPGLDFLHDVQQWFNTEGESQIEIGFF